jgi:hypothetical protein
MKTAISGLLDLFRRWTVAPVASSPCVSNFVARCSEIFNSNSFEAGEVLKRVQKDGDLFEPVLKLKQKLPSPKVLQDIAG